MTWWKRREMLLRSLLRTFKNYSLPCQFTGRGMKIERIHESLHNKLTWLTTRLSDSKADDESLYYALKDGVRREDSQCYIRCWCYESKVLHSWHIGDYFAVYSTAPPLPKPAPA
jgi:hypothetical protein